MPAFLDGYYDIHPKAFRWLWVAFASDRITLIGRGEADTAQEAERQAQACVNEAAASRPAPVRPRRRREPKAA